MAAVVGTRRRHAKRPRTETEVADPPRPLSRVPLDPSSIHHPSMENKQDFLVVAARSRRRDWANLTAGPAGLIAEEVLADDVASYIRFRAVCRSWRRCAPLPHGLDSPRRWIMLPEVFPSQPRRRDFLNVSTGKRIRVDLPNLRHHLLLGPTSDGLLVLCHKGSGAIRLLNPLTRQLTALPNAISLLSSNSQHDSNDEWWSTNGLTKLKELQGFSAGLAGGSTVALHFDDDELELAVAEPDDERWSRRRARSGSDSINSTLSYEDRFYCVTEKGIQVLDVAGAGQQPRLTAAVEQDQRFLWLHRDDSLVDNDGELIVVRPNGRTMVGGYEAHRVDLDARKMVPVCGLRGRAVFVCDKGAGRGRSVSVHAGLSASIRANAVYRCRCTSAGGDEGADCRPSIDAWHLSLQGWIRREFRACHGSILDYLSRYVCRHKDIVVPAPLPPRKRQRKANPKVIGNDWVN